MEHRQPTRCYTFEKMILRPQQLSTANTHSYRRDSRSLFLISAQMLTGLIMCRSCASKHFCCEFVSDIAMSCPEHYFYSGGPQPLSLTVCLPLPPGRSLSLGEGGDIDVRKTELSLVI